MVIDWEKYINSARLKKSGRNTTGDPRNEFESDFGRVIFSPSMRRMHDKTQVFPLTSDDNIHSRLTHSMEVMAIGYSLGLRVSEDITFQKKIRRDVSRNLREIPIILQNACLVHDIGNPPFGHFGEEVIKEYFNKNISSLGLNLNQKEVEDFIYFDGNAQGFRVLTKLQALDNPYGLNLTYATLGTFLKYPNADEIDRNKLARSKRGVFQSEREFLKRIAEGCELQKKDGCMRHPLAFLMEAADSICYLVMDIEDGYNKGWYHYEEIRQKIKDVDGLSEFFTKLENDHINYGKGITKVVKLRIFLISQLVTIAVRNFINNFDSICAGEYNKELIKDDGSDLQQKLSEFCNEMVFPNREIQSLELTGHSILTGLLTFYVDFILNGTKHYVKRAQGMISSSILRAAFMENGLPENSKLTNLNDYYKLRVIVDYISGMTDQFALNHYQKLSGQKII